MTPKDKGGGTVGRKPRWLVPRARSVSTADHEHRHASDQADLLVQRAGGAWLVHPAAGPDRRSLLFAAGLAPDPEYAVVVVDLPSQIPLDAVREALARAVPAGPRGVRVVFGRAPAQGAAAAGRWLATKLRQNVVVPDGVLLPSAGGALFIGADRGQGWVLCEPDGRERYVSRRFPRPVWDEWLPDRPRPVGTSVVAEPVGAGVWLRPAQEDAARDRHRSYLAARLHCRSDAATLVVGAPGAPHVTPDDVARFWRGLPQNTGTAPRVVLYGTPAPDDRPFGALLAALTGDPVHVYNGFPTSDPLVGRAALGDVLFMSEEGTPGRPVLAREYLHLPPEPALPPHPPLALDHRWPLGHLPMLRQGLYHGGAGTVLEVLPWGLWIRPSAEPPYADEVRAAPTDPHHELVLCDDSVPSALPRLQQLAQDVVRRLPAETGLLVRVLTAGRPWGVTAAVPAGEGIGAVSAVPEAGDGVGAEAGGIRTEEAGGYAAGADGAEGSEAEPARDGAQAEGARATAPPATRPRVTGTPRDAAIVAMALRHHPELGRGCPPETVQAALAAVRLQLTLHGRHPDAPPTIDEAALEGLAMLPAHGGAVALRGELSEAAKQWYGACREVTEPGVCAASLTGNLGGPGDTDILIRSVTGRRTALLEPERPDRVLFLPQTRFEVLGVRARQGERLVVLMRELLPAEAPGGALGRMAVRELEEALRVWRADEASGVVQCPAPDPFARPPGLGGPGLGHGPPTGLSERSR
ncbi:hypothetical protein [Streptomyces flaveolus]|uniref:hypothetical protein n=1 Tax=Streptomyces flaveolus TaxID=67297 RepID=UPI0036FFE18A